MQPMILKLAQGQSVKVGQEQLEHLLAHPEVTEDLLRAALERICPNPNQTEHVYYIDLSDIGFVGFSSLVETPALQTTDVTTFMFRPKRTTPSRVAVGVDKTKTSKLCVCLKPEERSDGFVLITAYAASKPAKKEPISASIDPDTLNGMRERQECLEFWLRHALAVEPDEGQILHMSWQEVLEQYGRAFHS